MTIERRRFPRINVGFEAETIYEGKSYKWIIDNISEKGVSVETFPAEIAVDFVPGRLIDLSFQSPPGETLLLNCRIKWSSRFAPQGLKYRIGMEVLDPPWEDSNYFL